MFIDDAVFAQRVGRFKDIFDAGAIAAVGVAYDMQQVFLGQIANIGIRISVHRKSQCHDGAVVGTASQPARNVCAARHFTTPQRAHGDVSVVVGDAICHPATRAACI